MPEHAHRFFLAIDNGVIVGAAGYRPADESIFLGTEIIWTAVDEHYRKRGIAGDLINRILLDTEGDIYVSAWRTMEGGQKAHLDTVLVKRGFKLAQYPHITWESGITCEKENAYMAENARERAIVLKTHIFLKDRKEYA